MGISGQLHAPAILFPGERGWVSPRDSTDVMQKRQISLSYREPNPDSSVVQPVRAIPALSRCINILKVANKVCIEGSLGVFIFVFRDTVHL
jgi:hypothetical protein